MGNTDLFEVFSNFKVILQRVVTFDLCVAVVDDGQEHVEQYEEDEEHIQEEVDGTEDEVSILQSIEVEISQDDTEQGEAVKIKKHKYQYHNKVKVKRHKQTCCETKLSG